MNDAPMIEYRLSPPVENAAMNALFVAAWENHTVRDFEAQLRHSLLYVCAYNDQRLVGFVNVAWDGGIHAFLLDTTTHPAYQRRGIGVELVQRAVEAARARGIQWMHVDYEPHLAAFYGKCGFRHTAAGLLRLK